ncbi:MAG: hypothetical protein PHH54_01190 [Candidatus Nanoarchaeia archaeon]|nr:hypothetical protein [Candidatus Nanoarchaeia archaeon]MDD5740578.1 hypothetical protein [Candidatus Nanoarchaeia archaeon]
MVKRCVICKRIITVLDRKIEGTMLRVKELCGKMGFIYVCSECMKADGWVEKAKIKGV